MWKCEGLERAVDNDMISCGPLAARPGVAPSAPCTREKTPFGTALGVLHLKKVHVHVCVHV